MQKKTSIRLKIKTPDFDSSILKREFEKFIAELDTDGTSQLIGFSCKELKQRNTQ